MLLLFRAKFFRSDHVGKRAPRFHYRQEYLLVRIQDRCGLSHEHDAAEYDDIGVGPHRGLGKRERVTADIRDLLYLVPLVIMNDDDGIPLFLQFLDSLLE